MRTLWWLLACLLVDARLAPRSCYCVRCHGFRLQRLVPVVPVSASEGQRPMSATAFYGYLAFPVHERPPYVVRNREGKVVVPDVEIRRGSLRLVPIDPADPRPVYQQLADSLRARILSAELPPGSLLPSESEFIHEYGISRGPIRQAVAQLKAEGLVEVRQGRGVFVRRRPTRYRLSADRFLHARRHAERTPFPEDLATGGTPRLEVRRHAVVEAPPQIADRLKLREDTRVLARGFRLFADDEPVQVADFYVPYDLVKGTRVEDPASEPWPGGDHRPVGEPRHRGDRDRRGRCPAHQPLVSRELFQAVRARVHQRPPSKPRKERRDARVYPLRGRLHCRLCDRRLQGQWIRREAYYRCRYPAEYATAVGYDHPRSVYLREADLLPRIDAWLGRLTDPDHLEATCQALAAASDQQATRNAQRTAARQQLADCDRRLARYRAALEADTDPAIVGQWIAEVTATRQAAEAALHQLVTAPEPLSPDAIEAVLKQVGGLADALDKADSVLRAQLYEELGIEGAYDPGARIVEVRADLRRPMVRVGGGT
ncbi:MAG TPA: GntR family transcriptional regulator [Actinomycetes bacterium]